MALAYIAEAFVASVRRRAYLPSEVVFGGVGTNQPGISDADILNMAAEEELSYLAPLIMGFREEYYVRTVDLPLTVGQVAYDLPYRAVGERLRWVGLVDSNGNTITLPRAEPEALPAVGSYATQSTQPYGHYFQGEQIVLIGAPSFGIAAQYLLRVKYFLRPAQPVKYGTSGTQYNDAQTKLSPNFSVAGQYCKVTAVAGNVLTVSVAPTSFPNGTAVDIIQGIPPFRSRLIDGSIASGGNTTSLTLASGSIDIAPGDFVCQVNESPFPTAPVELHQLLAQRVALLCLERLGRMDKVQTVAARLQEMEGKVPKLIANRAEGNPRHFMNGMARWRSYPGRGSW